MSYTHQLDQVRCDAAAAILVTTTGIKARFINNGLHPVVVDAASYVTEVASTVAATVITIRHRPTIASATGQTTIDTITVPITGDGSAVGDVIYVDGLDQKVLPGEEVVFDVTTASTAGSGHFIIRTKPSWDQPENITGMFESA